MNTINSFNEIVDRVQHLSLEEKEDLKFLIDRYVVEERRKVIAYHVEEGRKELREGSLAFSSDLDSLKTMLDE